MNGAPPPFSAVSVRGVSKQYQLYARHRDRLKALLWPRHRGGDPFWALRDISFEVHQGQVLGLIGANGSGKSTLLQLITGVLQPTTGTVATYGRVTALLELGAGFHPEFTGRENALLNGVLLGLNEAEVRERLPRILAFAEIGDFIDRPVKTYSSGMYVRLAFSVAVNVDPDVLIVDEALAVGDAYFQQRCLKRMQELRAQGKTMIFVSHDTAAIKALCDRAILLDHGRIVADGPAPDVVMRYLQGFVLPQEQRFPQPALTSGDDGEGSAARVERQEASGIEIERQLPNIDARYGSGAARVLGLACYDPQGRRSDDLQAGEALIVHISVRFERHVAQPNIGFILRDRLGSDLAGTNCILEGLRLPPADPGAVYTVQFRMELPPLHPGAYTISPSAADGALDDYVMCDWIENARAVHIGGLARTGCVMHPPVAATLLGIGTLREDPRPAEAHGSR